MTAQEMFEQLGWELKQTCFKLVYFNETYNETIEFDKQYEEYYIENLAIDMPTLKAINKQCQELGWIE